MTDNLSLLVQKLPEEADAALITSPINRRYYLGFSSSAGTVVATRDGCYFIIDSRYIEAAQAAIKNCEIILQDKVYEQVGGLLKKHGAKTAAIEADAVSMSEYARLCEKLPGVELLKDDRLSRLIETQRSVKSEYELARIQAAQDIADKTFTHILDFIRPGRTELEIAIEMEQFSRRAGSERPSFEFIVGSGPNGSRPHAEPCDRKIRDGDFIVLDFGMTVNGYVSDMTRTVAVGHVSDKQREVYGIVKKAQQAGLDAIKAGAKCFDVDKAARDVIDTSPYKGLCGHGIGHAIGLQCHENPRFNTESKDVLVENVCMSVEPGIYIPGEFGVRIEDIVAAKQDGYHNFVKSSKELILL